MDGNISVMPVLGIDVGGSKTVCLLADDDERVLAEGREEGANLQGAGELALEKVLHSVMEKTLEGTGVFPSAICLGIAGVDRASDEAVVRSIMSRIGYKARILVVNDALIALQAGVGDAAGIVIVSGTGSIAYGRNDQGEASRAGGWGYVLGDEGSGYWIGRLALRAVVRHADGRGRATEPDAAAARAFRRRARERVDSQGVSRRSESPIDRRGGRICAARERRGRRGRHRNPESRCR